MIRTSDLSRVLDTYEIPDIETAEDAVYGPLKLVIEIVQRPNGTLFPRLLRKDRFECKPAYSQHKQGLLENATIEVIVPDDNFDWTSKEFSSQADALEFAVAEISVLLQP